MKYLVHPQCIANIKNFYLHVAIRYAHTYSKTLMHNNVDEAIQAIYQIENGLLRREPTIKKWHGCFMANTKKWYFAYQVFGDTVVVLDACHAQNMTSYPIHDNP